MLYAATGARGLEWQDSGLHQYRIITGQLENPIGLALSHPLHYYLGRAALAIPLGHPAHRLNLLSGLAGAVGVGVLAGLVLRLTRSPGGALVAATTLALTHSYWQMSALTETYTLAAALMTLEWSLLWRYVRTRQPAWLVAVFAVNGLHVADHLLGLLTLATYGVFLLERIARRRVAPVYLLCAAVAWLIAALPYELLVLAHFQRTGDLAATLQSALFGGGPDNRSWAKEVLNTSLSLDQLKLVVLTFGYGFPSAAALLALVGVFRRARGRARMFRYVLLAQTVIVFVFVGRYSIKDLYTFFVPVCVLTAFWVGLGTATLLRRARTRRMRGLLATALAVNALLPIAVYLVFPAVARERGWLRARLTDVPFRDEYAAFFQPWRFQDDSPRQLADAVLAQAAPDGWIIANATTCAPLALTRLLDPDAPDVRVFWYRRDMLDPTRPELTNAALAAHVLQGGRACVMPEDIIKFLIDPPLTIDFTEPFWRVEVADRPPDDRS